MSIEPSLENNRIAIDVRDTQWDSADYQDIRRSIDEFLLKHYVRFSLPQLVRMLNVTPDYITHVLSTYQVQRIGSRKGPTLIIAQESLPDAE